MQVVKLGGSLQDSPYLPEWRAVLEACAGRDVVIVPGGGRFADMVRDQQRRLAYSDAEAHRRALLAMEHYGALLAEGSTVLRSAASVEAIRVLLRNAHIPIWMPSAMVLSEPDLPASWDLTSDSLALWLGRGLGARRVIIVKSTPLPSGVSTPAALSAAGFVDRLFPHYAAMFAGDIDFLSAGDAGRLQDMPGGGWKN
jgi:aspartokinase-like uncharacterized kinase